MYLWYSGGWLTSRDPVYSGFLLQKKSLQKKNLQNKTRVHRVPWRQLRAILRKKCLQKKSLQNKTRVHRVPWCQLRAILKSVHDLSPIYFNETPQNLLFLTILKCCFWSEKLMKILNSFQNTILKRTVDPYTWKNTLLQMVFKGLYSLDYDDDFYWLITSRDVK